MSRVLHDKPALLSENMASCQKPSIAEEANEDMKPRLDDDVWYEAWEGVGRRGGDPSAADSGTRRACLLKPLSTTALANPIRDANGRSSIGRAGSHRFYWEERTTPRPQREIKFSSVGLERYL